jgi:hypothetical protein
MPVSTVYRSLKAMNQCVKECGRPALPLKKHCSICLARYNVTNLTRKHHYVYLGLCRECGKPRPPETTHIRCDRCHEANCESARRTRRLRPRDLR